MSCSAESGHLRIYYRAGAWQAFAPPSLDMKLWVDQYRMLQGMGPSLAFKLILASRIVVGLGEGVALPSMNNLVASLPKSLQSTGLGVAFTGFHSGSLLAYP